MSEALTLPGLARPQGGFRVILADPPWHYEMYSAKGEAKSPQAQYDTMTLAAICAMPVGAYAAADAALFLWSTWPTTWTHVAPVLAAWGFTPKTGLPWVKRTKHGKVHFGMGYIGRECTEPLCIATRGSPRWHGEATRLLLDAYAEAETDAPARNSTPASEDGACAAAHARASKHSVKPDDLYTLVETIQHATPRLELFARRPRAGWVSWGDGIDPAMHWRAPARPRPGAGPLFGGAA